MKKVLRSFYALDALLGASFGFTFATYATFLASQGLSLFEINVVNFFFFTTIFLCEIPTGAYADTYGRKRSVFVATAIFSLGMIVYFFSKNIYGFILAEIISGIGYTFMSGAQEAWFIDEVRAQGHTGSTKSLQAKSGVWRLCTSVLSTFCGSYLYTINPSLPFAATAIMFAVTGVVIMHMPERTFVRVQSHVREKFVAMWQTAIRSIAYTRTHSHARFYILVGCVQSLTYMGFNMQWQPLLAHDLTPFWKGLLGNSIQVSLFLGAMIVTHRVLHRIDDKRAVLFSIIGVGLSVVVTAMSARYILVLSVGAFLLHEVFRAIIRPSLSSYIHEHIPSRDRATIGSAASVYTHAAGAAGLLLSGYVAELIGIPYTWMISGALLMVTGAYIMLTDKEVRTNVVRSIDGSAQSDESVVTPAPE